MFPIYQLKTWIRTTDLPNLKILRPKYGHQNPVSVNLARKVPIVNNLGFTPVTVIRRHTAHSLPIPLKLLDFSFVKHARKLQG